MRVSPHGRFSIAAGLALMGLLTSCGYDNEQLLDMDAGCDSTSVSFKADIQPLLERQCNGCHGLSAASGGVVLEIYTDVRPFAKNGTLVETVEYNSRIRMPEAGKLPDCDIAKIRTWVRNGSPDN